MDSGDRNWSELPLRDAATELGELEVPSGATRPLSTTVGRRGRDPLPVMSGVDGEYMLMRECWVTDRSFISLKYAMTDRRARVYASRALSPSRRCVRSAASGETGDGVSNRSSLPLVLGKLTPDSSGPGEGKGVDGPPIGRKLRRFATRVELEWGERLGDEVSTESKLGDGTGEGLGNGEAPFTSDSSFGPVMDEETDVSGDPPGISMPREPVEDRRTSIRDRGFRLDAVGAGVDPDVDSETFARGVTPGLRVDGFEAGTSGFNLPIDIFFKKPHLPCCSFGLSSFLRNILRWRVVDISARCKESPRMGIRGREESEILVDCSGDGVDAASRSGCLSRGL